MTSCFKNELQGKYEKPISNHCHMITIETFLPLGKSLLALSRQYASLLTLSRWYALWEQRYQFIFRKRKERREENPSKVKEYIYSVDFKYQHSSYISTTLTPGCLLREIYIRQQKTTTQGKILLNLP